ncbi:MAG: hypothetical protein ACI9DF_005887, partial [Verrucomicrobiales bacterium]
GQVAMIIDIGSILNAAEIPEACIGPLIAQ